MVSFLPPRLFDMTPKWRYKFSENDALVAAITTNICILNGRVVVMGAFDMLIIQKRVTCVARLFYCFQLFVHNHL